MCASTLAKGSAISWFCLVIVGGSVLSNRVATPEWMELAGLALGLGGGGFLLYGLDLWRFRRVATELGMERLTGDASDGFSALEAYRTEREGRTVTLDYVGGTAGDRRAWTRVVTSVEAQSVPAMTVRSENLSKTARPDGLSPVDIPALDGRFDVYSTDDAFARAVLTGDPMELLRETNDIDELTVIDGRLTSKHHGRVLDSGVIETQIDGLVLLAEAIESESWDESPP